MTRELRNLQRLLYLSQRAVGDADALDRGPDVLAKRIARRVIRRSVFRALGPLARWPR